MFISFYNPKNRDWGRKKERKKGRIRRERINLISAVNRGNSGLGNSILGNPQMLP